MIVQAGFYQTLLEPQVVGFLMQRLSLIHTHMHLPLLFFPDLELSKLDEKLIQILAWQRLQQLMPSKSATEGQKKATLNGLLTTPGNLCQP